MNVKKNKNFKNVFKSNNFFKVSLKMQNLEYKIIKTSKDKDAILIQNFIYNFKSKNKDLSHHYVCNQGKCYSSITIRHGVIIKINGKKTTEINAIVHAKHEPLTDEDILGMNFTEICKKRIEKSSLSAGPIYLEEQSKLLK